MIEKMDNGEIKTGQRSKQIFRKKERIRVNERWRE